MFQNKKIFYLLMFASMLSWGLSWVNGKILSQYITFYDMVFLRNIFTIISLIPIILFMKINFKISLKSLFLSFLASILLILYVKYYFLGLQNGTAVLGGTFVTTLIPILTSVLVAILYKKKTSLKDCLALGLGAVGVLTMIQIWSFDLEKIFQPQNLYFFIAALLWAFITITTSKTQNTSPIIFSLYMYIFSTIIVYTLFVDINSIPYEDFDFIFWVNMLCISILSTTFATTIYFYGISILGAKEVTTFVFLVPFFTILSSSIFLGEAIKLSLIIGTLLTIFALAILNNILVFKIKQ